MPEKERKKAECYEKIAYKSNESAAKVGAVASIMSILLLKIIKIKKANGFAQENESIQNFVNMEREVNSLENLSTNHETYIARDLGGINRHYEQLADRGLSPKIEITIFNYDDIKLSIDSRLDSLKAIVEQKEKEPLVMQHKDIQSIYGKDLVIGVSSGITMGLIVASAILTHYIGKFGITNPLYKKARKIREKYSN